MNVSFQSDAEVEYVAEDEFEMSDEDMEVRKVSAPVNPLPWRVYSSVLWPWIYTTRDEINISLYL